MTRKFSLKNIGIVLISLAVLGSCIHFLRTYQVRRNARALLAQADLALEKEDYYKEARYLQTYLSLAQWDVDTQARYALLLSNLARTSRDRIRAFFAIGEVLLKAPDRNDLRRQAIKLAGALGRPSDALFHLNVLHEQADEKDADLMEAIGNVEAHRRSWAKADIWYEKSARQDPKRISAYVSRARVLRRNLNNPIKADKVIADMVAANPDDPDAQMARIRYTRDLPGGTGQTEEFRKTLASLIKRHGKEYPDLFLIAANLEGESGDQAGARKLLLRGEELHPAQIAFQQELSRLELRAGNKKEALVYLRRIIDKLPPRASDYWTTVELLLEAGDKAEAAKLLGSIGRNEDTAPLLAYLEARLAFADGRWLQASLALEELRGNKQLPPELVATSHLLLARCYQRLGNPDQQLEAAQASLEQDLLWVPGLIGKAEALSALGQEEAAIRVYESILGRWSGAPLAAARLWISRNARVAEDQRDWDQPLALLNGSSATVQASAEAILVRGQLLVARKDLAGAVKVLEEGCKTHPKDVSLWLNLADAEDKGGQEAKATAALERARTSAGDQIEFRLANAQIAARKSNDAAHLVLALAERDAANKPAEERSRWLRSLGYYYLERGEVAPADRVLTEWSKAQPDDLDVWRGLFDVAVVRGQTNRLESIVQKLEKLEGQQGTLWRYGRALLLAQQGKPEDLVRAKTWLNEVRKRRPTWGRLYVLDGRIAEAESNPDRAIEQYKAALDRGEASPDVVVRLVRLLNAQRNYAESSAVLVRFRSIIPRTGELGRLVTLTTYYGSETPQAGLEMARKTLSEKSKDYQDHLLAGQIFWAADKREEAEKSFRRAVELNDKQPECHLALVMFLAEKEPKKAEESIKVAAAVLPPSDAPLALAACYEILGQNTQAEAQYKLALVSRPDDPAVQRAVAIFYLRRGQLARAEGFFRKLMEDKSPGARFRVAWARRTLALALAATGDYDRFRKALALLDENATGGTISPDDQRARALILARQPRERREAVKQLEAVFARIRPTPEEEFFLVTLLVANRDWIRAQQRMVRLLDSRDGANPIFLIYYLDQLIQHEELDEANRRMGQLEKLEPGSLRTTGIKARLLQARKEPGRAKDLVQKYAEAHPKDPSQQLGVARLLESLGFVKEAEPYYRSVAAALQEKNPQAWLPLIEYLGRRDRLPEALKLAEKIQGKVPDPVLAVTYINILREGQPTPEECKQAGDWLTKTKKQQADQALFDLCLANLSDLQGKTAEAITAYRGLLERDSRNILARNNLAVLLAYQPGKTEEALECIDKAIEIAGPQPNLLDSRAIVYLRIGQAAKAIADLEDATQMTPDPASYFRLASAYLATDDLRSARAAWAKAQSGGFALRNLHPLERPKAQQVREKLGGEKK